ncbi:hemicentin-2-like isoform X2 [Corticium candelabrum]|uniref:hemicentin-2-like isoform X2 n=1 Tax=Corticium candelabrum TaxID=121492 RepID=UPI002E253965|nr:hemicentin-2-like isoform X2 [Corticium candelabrum]
MLFTLLLTLAALFCNISATLGATSSPPTLQIWGPPTAVPIGATLTLTCQVTGKPHLTLTGWRKDGVDITAGGKFSEKVSGTFQVLQVWTVSKSDEGRYECVADSEHMNQTASYTIHVQEPPQIYNFSDATIVSEGASVMLHCLSKDHLFLRWKLNGVYVDYLPRYQVFDVGERMLIENVTESDAGVYTCVAFNQRFETLKDIELVVKYAPKVVAEPQDTVMPIGFSAVLRCIGKAMPHAQVSWLKDNKSISADTRLVQENDGLLFMKLRANDSGEYRCLLKNAIGTTSSRPAILQVIALESFVQQNISTIYDHSVSLPCNDSHQWTTDNAVIDFKYDNDVNLLHNGSLQLTKTTYETEHHYYSCLLHILKAHKFQFQLKNFHITVNQPDEAPVNITVLQDVVSWSQPALTQPILRYNVTIISTVDQSVLYSTIVGDSVMALEMPDLLSGFDYYLSIETVTAVGNYPSKPLRFHYARIPPTGSYAVNDTAKATDSTKLIIVDGPAVYHGNSGNDKDTTQESGRSTPFIADNSSKETILQV